MFLKWFVFCTIIIGCSAYYRPAGPRRFGTVSNNRDPYADKDKYLLPKNVRPTNYDLTLLTHIEDFDKPDATFAFEGTVTITIDFTQVSGDDAANRKITLHAGKDLQVKTATITVPDDPNADPPTTKDLLLTPEVDVATDHLTLTLTNKDDPSLVSGTYTLNLEFSGKHGDDMHGFYRSYYEEAGVKKWLVTTQFESYDARRAFPCFDEPEYKATYDISIVVSKDLVDNQNYWVLSNSPLESSDDNTDVDPPTTKTFKFKTTDRKISSYLIAFIVSDFVGTDAAQFTSSYPDITDPAKKDFKTWGRKQFIEKDKDGYSQANTSQLAGPAAMEVLTHLTGVGYAMPKVDQVGIPDFSAGAMENWGLTTYRERYLFFNETTDPLSTKQSVVTVTVHELAHQWFGDLVTLHWWSDIWLNEGFATFFEYHATDAIKVDLLDTSSWNIVGQFVNDELQSAAFETDGQETSRPLTSEVYAPGDIDANFDNVAYSKGGSVLRMWYHILGKDVFYSALNSYLTENAEAVGTPESLLDHIDAAIDEAKDPKPLQGTTANKAFPNWLTQPGYPVVNVTLSNNTLILKQERFLFSQPSKTPDSTWTIPITYTTDKELRFQNTTPSAFFDSKETTWKLTAEGATWVILNNQQTGYYRVNYDLQNWNVIGAALSSKFSDIPEINRAQIIDDVFSLARSTQHNYLNYDIAFHVSRYLPSETSLIPWKAALNNYNFIYTKLAANEEARKLITAKILENISPIFDKLNLTVPDKDSHTNRLLRIQIASWACRLGHEGCVKTANDLFGDKIVIGSADNKVHPDVLSTVVCSVVRQATDDQKWNQVWQMYLDAKGNNVVETLLLSALGCTKNATLIKNYLDKTLETTDAPIRKQDLTAVFSAVYNGNPENAAPALTFLSDNLDKIANTFGGLDPLGGMLRGIATKLSTDDHVKQMQDLKTKIETSENDLVKNGLSGATQAVDIVLSNKAWVEQKQESIVSTLKETPDAPGSAAMSALNILVFLTSVAVFLSL